MKEENWKCVLLSNNVVYTCHQFLTINLNHKYVRYALGTISCSDMSTYVRQKPV
jgi:hypothetical protein